LTDVATPYVTFIADAALLDPLALLLLNGRKKRPGSFYVFYYDAGPLLLSLSMLATNTSSQT